MSRPNESVRTEDLRRSMTGGLNDASSTGPRRTVSGELAAVDKYRDIAELGSGGMGEVYLSVQQGPMGFNKLVVIKRIRQSVANDPDSLAMFLKEARLAARLMHPNVVQTNEVGFDGHRHFIAMEYLDGQSLLAVRRRAAELRRPFPLAMQLRVLCEALNGLHYAHELADFDGTPLGIVHRDATPHNIFVTYDGQIKVVDFGIAKVGDTGETRTGILKGKVPYMAPEQINGRVDRRCDLFGVGVMMWEAIAQTRMWKGVGDVQIMYRLHAGDLPKLRDYAPDAPDHLVATVEKALATRADDRFATGAEMAAAIEEYLATIPNAPTTRDIGRWLSDCFSDTRNRIKTSIEVQLKALKEQPTNLSPVLLQERAPGETSEPGSNPIESGIRGDTKGQTSSLSNANIAANATTEMLPAARKSRSGLVAAIVAVLAIGGVTTFVLTRNHESPATAAAANAPKETANDSKAADPKTNNVAPTGDNPTATPPPVAAPTGEVCNLKITVTPPDAQVTLDDAPIASLDGKYPRDGAAHRLKTSANGYTPKTEWVTFDKDVIEHDVKLDKAAATPVWIAPKKATPKTTAVDSTPPPPPVTTAVTPPPPPADTGPAKVKPKSTIDTSNPY